MENYTAQELFELLNQQDECEWIEGKGGPESSHSVMETVCAFSNEPGLAGGYILMGVAEDKTSLFLNIKQCTFLIRTSFNEILCLDAVLCSICLFV